MRLIQYFLPLLRENPSEAQIVSHRLMLRAGMIRQSSAGIYSWLPLGLRVLKRVEQIVREEQNRAGAQEILMPTIQPAELWRESGRYDDYGKEMLRIRDRHEREMLYGPTNEEQVTTIVRDAIKSYRLVLEVCNQCLFQLCIRHVVQKHIERLDNHGSRSATRRGVVMRNVNLGVAAAAQTFKNVVTTVEPGLL